MRRGLPRRRIQPVSETEKRGPKRGRGLVRLSLGGSEVDFRKGGGGRGGKVRFNVYVRMTARTSLSLLLLLMNESVSAN